MERMDILFGFRAPDFEKQIAEKLYDRGFEAVIVEKCDLVQIREYISMHPDCQTLVLMERFGNLEFTAEQFSLLNDDSDDLNIICLLGKEKYGTKYMQTLYAAGITSALFGKKDGKDKKERFLARDVVDVCVKKRTRKDARKYYGIANVGVDIGMLSPETYTVYFKALFNEENGKNLIIRYLNVASKMTPAQNEDFLEKLPKDTLEELKEYKEFYDFMDALKAQGVRVNFRRPKHVKVGILDSGMLLLNDSGNSEKKVIREEKKQEEFDFGSDAFSSLVNEMEEMERQKEGIEESLEEELFEEEKQETKPEDTTDEFLAESVLKDDSVQETEGKEETKKKRKFPVVLLLAVILVLGILGVIVFLVLKGSGVIGKSRSVQPVTNIVSSEGNKEPVEDLNPVKTVEPILPFREYMKNYLDTENQIGGAMVVSVINMYPKEQFRVLFVEENKQIIYIDGGASETDVKPEELFTLTEGEGEFVFTKVE